MHSPDVARGAAIVLLALCVAASSGCIIARAGVRPTLGVRAGEAAPRPSAAAEATLAILCRKPAGGDCL